MTIYFLLGKYADTSVSLKGRNSKKEVVVRVLFRQKEANFRRDRWRKGGTHRLLSACLSLRKNKC